MKKIVIAAILTIIIFTCWLLYLNYSHQRFIDDIGVTHKTSKRSTTNKTDTQTFSDDAQSNPVDEKPSDNEVKSSPLINKRTYDGTDEKPLQKTTVEKVINSFEKQIKEAQGSKRIETENTFERFLESQGITIEQYEKQEIALETLQRIINNPMRWLDGNPNMILISNEELGEILDANDNFLENLDEDMLERISSSLNTKDETQIGGSSILPKNAKGIKQNTDGSWSFVYETKQNPTQ